MGCLGLTAPLWMRMRERDPPVVSRSGERSSGSPPPPPLCEARRDDMLRFGCRERRTAVGLGGCDEDSAMVRGRERVGKRRVVSEADAVACFVQYRELSQAGRSSAPRGKRSSVIRE